VTKRWRYALIAGSRFSVACGAGATLAGAGCEPGEQTYSRTGYFYRLQAKFEVKDTANGFDFDYVVACNIRVTRWRDEGCR